MIGSHVGTCKNYLFKSNKNTKIKIIKFKIKAQLGTG